MNKTQNTATTTITGLDASAIRRLREYFRQNYVTVIRNTDDSIIVNTEYWYAKYVVDRAIDALNHRTIR